MIAEILSTGDELRLGSVVDTNSAYIAQRLEETGLEVVRHTCVGDDMEMLIAVLKEIACRVDIAIVTGGLGPTPDDLTAEAAAEAAGVELILDTMALTAIENLFKTRKRPMPASNRKQAMFPKGAECIHNPIGTAPGFLLKMDGCIFFFLPGVPTEMRRMLTDTVLPRIETLQGNKRGVFLTKTLSMFGMPEAEVGERLSALNVEYPEIKVGLRAVFPQIQVNLYARGYDEKMVQERLHKAVKWALDKIGKRVFSQDGDSMEDEIGGLLRRRGATIGIAESCTGGLISDWLTNVPGSSDYFLFSGVTYSNDAKIKVLGVSPETIARYGAVHEETAKEMAEGARRIAGATYGLSTSGIAGPDGGTPDKPIGTVCIGLATPYTAKGVRYHFPYQERLRNKTIFAMTALNLLRRELLG